MKQRMFLVFFMIWIFTAGAFGASIILNEYNAVGASNTLENNGWDTFFGPQVVGNGGDWFEMVVIEDHLDIRNWSLLLEWVDDTTEGDDSRVLDITDNILWADLRSGTIITVSEDLADDVSYDPENDDWWINVRAFNAGPDLYIEDQNFRVNSSNWNLTIRNEIDEIIFGPAGEGINPVSGVTSAETFRLEDDPSALITALSNYDDGDNSTFGSPNIWGSNVQDFSSLRSVVPEPASLLLISLGCIILRRTRR